MPPTTKLRAALQRESLMMSAVASVFFISWGLYANWEHGKLALIQVAITQGAISFISTFLSAEALRRLYLRLVRYGINEFLTIPIGYCLINGCIYIAHRFAGTPEVLLTMLPGATISVIFCTGYTLRLRHASKPS